MLRLFGDNLGRKEWGGVLILKEFLVFMNFWYVLKQFFELIFDGRTPAHMLSEEWYLLA